MIGIVCLVFRFTAIVSGSVVVCRKRFVLKVQTHKHGETHRCACLQVIMYVHMLAHMQTHTYTLENSFSNLPFFVL